MGTLLEKYTPKHRARILAMLNRRCEEMEAEPDLREMCDSMIELAGGTPDRLTRRIALMSAIVMAETDITKGID